MAYTNPLKIANGLALDFTVSAADPADNFLGLNTDGEVTSFSSIPATRVSSGGNVTEATSSVLTITGGTAAVLTSGLTIQVKLAGAAQSGYLSSTDWNTFNNKLGTTLTDGQILIGSSLNVATGRTISGDFTISNTGVGAISSNVIVNDDINATAAIAFSKMAAFVGLNLITATNGSGFITTVAGFTTTIAGYLTNITSDVQAQFTTTNQRIVNLPTNAIVRTPTASEDGYAILWDNTAGEWTLGPGGGGGGTVVGPGSSTDNAIVRWNSTGGNAIQDSGIIISDTNDITGIATVIIGTAGLKLLDTDASHSLIFSIGSNLTADRTLTITTGDADRVLTMSGNATVDDWFDQSVKTTANPLFASVTVSNASGLHILDSDSSHDLILRTTSDLTADRELIFVTGDATRTITFNASGTVYVTGGTDVVVADGGTGASSFTAGSILIGDGTNPITTDTTFTFNTTNNFMTIDGARYHSGGGSATGSVFIGQSVGNFTGTGDNNIAIGSAVLSAFTTAFGNVIIGYQAGDAITTSSSNAVLGYNALSATTTGGQNVAIGYESQLIATGNNNITIGYASGDNITTGSFNVIIGSSVDAQSTTDSGQLSIANAIFGINNFATGTTVSAGNIGLYVVSPSARLHLPAGSTSAAPLKLTSGTALTTEQDGALEYHSSHLYFTIGSTRYQLDQQGGISGLTTNRIPYATSATTLGDDSAFTWDATNDALTVGTARFHTFGVAGDVFIGNDAGNFTQTGDNNIGIGAAALNTVTSGTKNTAVGANAGTNVTTGFWNVVMGYNAGTNITTGGQNIVIGGNATGAITSGNQNVIIGSAISAQSATANGQLSIQNAIFGTGNTATGTTASTGSIGIFEPAPTRDFEVAGSVAIKAGSSTGQIARVGGIIQTDTTTTGNVGTGEDTIFTYTVPANVLSTDNDMLIGMASGTLGANTNAKRFRLKFGATTVMNNNLTFGGAVAGVWTINFRIIRTGATSQKCYVELRTNTNNNLYFSFYATASETLSGTVSIDITAEATADNDVVGEIFNIEWHPAE